MTHRQLTQEALLAELRAAYGDDPMNWAFTCPSCNTITTGAQLSAALKTHPRTDNRTGDRVITSDILGQECIGRTDPEQGCDWAAYGLFRGPWEIALPNGNTLWGFPIAATENGSTS